jgi:hypothetical protein
MAIDTFQTVDIIEVMENFIERRRPPESIRHQLDLSYKIEDQSVLVFELRPRWNKPEEIMECNIAKATFVKTKNLWSIFWQRSDLKWHSYTAHPTVKTLKGFVKLVVEDKHSCFWG